MALGRNPSARSKCWARLRICALLTLVASAAITHVVIVQDIVLLLEANLIRISLWHVQSTGLTYDHILYAVGERSESPIWKDHYSTALHDELANPNWQMRLEERSRLTRATTRLEQRAVQRRLDIRTQRLLGRLQLYSRNYSGAFESLKEVTKSTDCETLDPAHRGCYHLWIDTGDALDGLGMPEAALQYYLAAGLEGRREAAAELALRIGHGKMTEGDLKEARIWYERSREWLPNALATQYAWLSAQPIPDYSSLRYFDRSVSRRAGVLQLHADPRIERRNAEASVGLLRSAVWDHRTFNRVLAFRAWQLDRQSLDSSRLTSVWTWTLSYPRRSAWERSAKAYFESLTHLLPDDPYVWYYFGEVLERQGMCEKAEKAYFHAHSLGLPRDLDRGTPPKVGPCMTDYDHELPITPGSISALSLAIDFERWMNYGQTLNLTAASTEEFGYPNQYPVRWVFGPDTLRAREGHVSFRADCLWQQNLPGKTPAFLVLSVVDIQKGQILPVTVPKGHLLEVEYWWQATGETRLEFHAQDASGDTGKECTGSMVVDEESSAFGWRHTKVAYRSDDEDRILTARWYVKGCGTVWLDGVTFTVFESGRER